MAESEKSFWTRVKDFLLQPIIPTRAGQIGYDNTAGRLNFFHQIAPKNLAYVDDVETLETELTNNLDNYIESNDLIVDDLLDRVQILENATVGATEPAISIRKQDGSVVVKTTLQQAIDDFVAGDLAIVAQGKLFDENIDMRSIPNANVERVLVVKNATLQSNIAVDKLHIIGVGNAKITQGTTIISGFTASLGYVWGINANTSTLKLQNIEITSNFGYGYNILKINNIVGNFRQTNTGLISGFYGINTLEILNSDFYLVDRLISYDSANNPNVISKNCRFYANSTINSDFLRIITGVSFIFTNKKLTFDNCDFYTGLSIILTNLTLNNTTIHFNKCTFEGMNYWSWVNSHTSSSIFIRNCIFEIGVSLSAGSDSSLVLKGANNIFNIVPDLSNYNSASLLQNTSRVI